jgi:hypothetical protein
MSSGFVALSTANADRRLRALFGIYTSFAEVLAIGGADPTSVLSLEAEAGKQGARLVVLRTRLDVGQLDPATTQPQRAAIVYEIERGHDVIAFNRPLSVPGGPRFGWWRRDRRTGEMIAVLENYEGGAQTATEYPLTKAFAKGVVVGAAYGLIKCKVEYGMSADCRRDMACKGLFGGVAAWASAAVAGLLTYMTIGTDAMGNAIWVWTTQAPSGSTVVVVIGGAMAAAEGLCKRVTGGTTVK